MPAFPDDVLFVIVKELKQLLREDISRHDRYSGRQPKFAPYAGVSRQWNAIIERETFRHIRVSSTDLLHEGCGGEAPDQGLVTTARFKEMMNRDPVRRRKILRHINFVASYSFSVYSTMGRLDAGRTTNDEHFSRSVHEFWKMLEHWELPLSLTFVQAPISKGDWSKESPAWLNLVGDSLPRLRSVTSFSVDDELVVWPSSLMTIVESLTHLTNAKLILNDDIEDPKLRRRWREDLGHGISQISITCRDFYARLTDRSHGFEEQPAVAPGGPDTFCINLRTLSTHLRHLHLEQARISAALFWPGADEKNQASLPSWPHLETLLIQLEPVDSFGRFYADPTPEEVACNASHNELRPWDPI
ncbi:uncharacterized protein LTHEOB_2243 [Lasiodiplodia theobromae]|uniref:uncharacterized protein n=1 Tax=Lasiodiplodia theobromae TaxID=45133 RepID=UPI0015C353A2|nr:uncharacterized protein LTHEOB_2243 [Lasiodiplodia theobromae]KAF4536482.1 hypothetical protein LTHEOB_2243 [Lasiodiplodia theobromae]